MNRVLQTYVMIQLHVIPLRAALHEPRSKTDGSVQRQILRLHEPGLGEGWVDFHFPELQKE